MPKPLHHDSDYFLQTLKMDVQEPAYLKAFAQELTFDTVSNGISLEVGSDKEALQTVVDGLGITDAIARHALKICDVTISASSASRRGSLWGFAAEVGVVEALDLIQAERWPMFSYPSAGPTAAWSLISGKLETEHRTALGFLVMGRYSYNAKMVREIKALNKQLTDSDQDYQTSPARALHRSLSETGGSIPFNRTYLTVSLGELESGMAGVSLYASNRYKLTGQNIAKQRPQP